MNSFKEECRALLKSGMRVSSIATSTGHSYMATRAMCDEIESDLPNPEGKTVMPDGSIVDIARPTDELVLVNPFAGHKLYGGCEKCDIRTECDSDESLFEIIQGLETSCITGGYYKIVEIKRAQKKPPEVA